MKQNIAINFFSPVHMGKGVDAATGLRFACVTENPFVLEVGTEPFPGFQTNEAPLANVVDLLAQDGEQLDRVYCLVTPQCISRAMGGENSDLLVIENEAWRIYPSPFDFWCTRMKRLRPALTEAIFIPILLRYREDALIEDIEGHVASLTERIKADAGGFAAWGDCHIYADITGGARYVNMMMTSVLQFLQYDGMQIEKMLYADFHTLSQEYRIFDVHAAGDVYKLVAGADAFVSYGISRTIEEYFGYDTATGRAAKPISSALKDVLGAMHTFSDVIQICQTGNVPHALDGLSEALAAFLEMPEEERTVDDRMFMQIIDTITEGYGALLAVADGETERYEVIIRWCAEKGLLQQAMTFATEWLPVCFIRRKIVYPLPMLRSCARSAVDRMHPGWMQNFIISPNLYWNAIQERKKKNDPIVLQLGLEKCTFQQGDPNSSEARWAAWQDTWQQLLEKVEVVRTDCGKSLMLDCLRTHFYLRERRNLMNHAIAENVSRREIGVLLDDALTALAAATDRIQKGVM